MLFWCTVSCLHGAALERASGQGEPVVEASSFSPLPVSSSSWLSPVMEGHPLCLCAHAHHSCLQVTAGHCSAPEGQGGAGPPRCCVCVPASHAGTCSGHLLLLASVASTLGASLVLLPSYPLLSSCLISVPETFCAVTFFLLLLFRSVVSSINLIWTDIHLLGWSFLKTKLSLSFFNFSGLQTSKQISFSLCWEIVFSVKVIISYLWIVQLLG